jgi:hypothetical protein
VRACLQRVHDARHYPIEIRQNVIVPEAQDAKPLFFEKRRPPGVILSLFIMLAAVCLNHQSTLEAYEIYDIRPNPDLPSKLATHDLPAPQTGP